MANKFLGVCILLIVALSLQFYFGDLLGVWINFVLALLISASFFLNLTELILLAVLAVSILNWKPEPSPEIMLLAFLPIVIYAIKHFFSWQHWVISFAGTIVGVVALYLFLDIGFLFSHFRIFAIDISATALFGLLAFAIQRALSTPTG